MLSKTLTRIKGGRITIKQFCELIMLLDMFQHQIKMFVPVPKATEKPLYLHTDL